MKYDIIVLGAGESGTGAAILAKHKGFHVLVSDFSKIGEKHKVELEQYNIEWEEEQHTEELILQATEIIKSPGIPNTAPIVSKAIERGIPIISEIEFASRFTKAKMIGITGSNGKTTTTSLIYHLLKTNDYNVGIAGNIGYSLARQVALDDKDCYVIELSSFQLDNMYLFKADIAILLNITPDHLDRYEYVFQNYVNSKFRITQNQTSTDKFIFWADDAVIKSELAKRTVGGSRYPFTLESKKEGLNHLTIAGENNIYIDDYKLKIPRIHSKLSGQHNLYNTMAALIAVHLLGMSKEQMIQGLETFTGVEHRLEYVASIHGVDFINDSKATNVDSCWYALQAMTKPTILILGGKDKGNNYDQIKELVKDNCKGLIFLGADNSKLNTYFKDFDIPIADTNNIQNAIQSAIQMSKAGDVVLLSPCCASFDLFSSYEDRGTQFKNEIKILQDGIC